MSAPKIYGCGNWRELYAEYVRGTGEGIYTLFWDATRKPKVIYCDDNGVIAALLEDNTMYALRCGNKKCTPIPVDELQALYEKLKAIDTGALQEEETPPAKPPEEGEEQEEEKKEPLLVLEENNQEDEEEEQEGIFEEDIF